MISRTSTFVALLLLALWLPATQHCGLEAAGVLASHVGCHDSSECETEHNQSTCHIDNCDSFEDGTYKPSFETVKLPTPVLYVLTCLCCITEISPETIIVSLISPARSDAPPELAPSWQFSTRAAPAPRAPGYLA